MTPSPQEIARTFDEVSLGSPENAVGFVVWRLAHRFQREIDQSFRPIDLTHLQFTVLGLVAWMSREGRPVTQAELARFSSIHPMQISTVMRALELKAMIRRAPARGAAKPVAITAKGLGTLRAAFPLAREVQQRIFGTEGSPGGTLLELLLRIDRAAGDPA